MFKENKYLSKVIDMILKFYNILNLKINFLFNLLIIMESKKYVSYNLFNMVKKFIKFYLYLIKFTIYYLFLFKRRNSKSKASKLFLSSILTSHKLFNLLF